MEVASSILSVVLDPDLLLLVFAGTLGGVLIGALPGLTSSMATALLVPFTVSMDPVSGIALLAAIYCAATFGGSITAILINAPGTPTAAATALDGYPMALRGEAGRALGMATVASVIGGIFSLVVMIAAAPLLARTAYSFGPPEYFALALFGLSMLASISTGSAVRNLMGGTFGVLLATMGTDFTTGIERFTFDLAELSDGINFVPVMIGIFGGAEMLAQAGSLKIVYERVSSIAVRLPSFADIRLCWKTILRSSGIGTFIGILPAEGATIAAMIGYNEARRWSKNKAEFGQGAIEGIAGPEAANNAATGGAMVPTLALGIPGSGTTAIILVALIAQGLRPGPYLFQEQPHLLYAIFASMLVANIMFLGIGLVGAKVFARITLIPRTFLWPAVFALAIIGSYALQQSMIDVYVMFVFALIGYFLKGFGFAPAPIIMGLILGSMVENTLKQSLLLFDMEWWQFLARPICLTFFALTILSLCGPFFFGLVKKRWQN